ncbi:hypothetical protein Goshw_013624 [Gossypium schwendimanii]|uniref:Cell wall protein n=1 Tax=Gossypium schwendimanii TaxID=34291 RepID=A0A7J9LXC3_GOSSC|nr:hypothetical protein [Gossypium schwendimanii]
MACKISSLLLPHIFILSILFATAGQAIAARDISKNDYKMKQPEYLKRDRSVLIPGLGRVLLPLVFKHHNSHTIGTGTHTGSSGSHFGSTIGGHHQIPGGDDTFVPNPGFEVPIPTSGGAGIARTNPHP